MGQALMQVKRIREDRERILKDFLSRRNKTTNKLLKYINKANHNGANTK